MRLPRTPLAILSALALLVLPSRAQATRGLETFEAAWRLIDEQHFDPEFNGVDWDAVRRELRPRAEAAADTEALREVLRAMLARLGQSHFRLIPAEELPAAPGRAELELDQAGGVGLDLALVDGRPLVVGVDPLGSAASAGVRTGWIVTSIDGATPASLMEAAIPAGEEATIPSSRGWRALVAATWGPVGEPLGLAFLDGADLSLELFVPRREREVEAFNQGRLLPTFHVSFAGRIVTREVEGRPVEANVLRFSHWFPPIVRPFQRALDASPDSDGVVIDLRGNPGGAGNLVASIAGCFLDDTRLLGVQRMRRRSMEYRARPRSRTFDGPVAVLIDGRTGSTSEVFTGGLQSVGRVRVFGSTSVGAVLPARMSPLPNGDALMHAIGDFRTSDGTLLEGRGVIPDEPAPWRRAALLRGEDEALEAAVRWIASASRPASGR